MASAGEACVRGAACAVALATAVTGAATPAAARAKRHEGPAPAAERGARPAA